MQRKLKKKKEAGLDRGAKNTPCRDCQNVDINDVLELAKESIMGSYGGLSAGDIEYIGDIDKLKFKIPKKDRKGKCAEIWPPDEEGGCGHTGGACICGKDKGHEGLCQCELCGHEW